MEVTVYDTNFLQLATIEEYESLVWTERYDSPGEIELVVLPTVEMLDILREDNYITIPKSNKAMIIDSIEIKTDVELGNRLFIRGLSLESILSRRIILQTTRFNNSSLQNGIQQLLNENIISSSQSHRDVSRLQFVASTDPTITALTTSAEYYRQLLDEVIIYLCKKASIGYEITLDSSFNFIFKLYNGVDRSFLQSTNPYVIFSRSFDNLINSQYIRSKRFLKTYVHVLGGPSNGVGSELPHSKEVFHPNGRGSDLALREDSMEADDISRFNLDGTDKVWLEHLAELTARGDDYLRDRRYFTHFDSQVYANISFKYGEDYHLGDIVQTQDEYGTETRSRVSSVSFSVDASGSYVYPTFVIIY